MSPLAPHDLVTLIACACNLALATIALLRLGRSPLAWPLALLSLAFFVENAADVAYQVNRVDAWSRLDEAAATLLAPLGLRFVIVFVGEGGRPRGVERAIGLWFLAIEALCLAALAGVDAVARPLTPDRWALLILPGALATFVVATLQLRRHLGRSGSMAERARTRLVIGAFAVGMLGQLFDLAANTGLAFPRLGPASSAITTLLLVFSVQRLGLFEAPVSWVLAANAVVAALLQIAAYVALFVFAGHRSALLVTVAASLALAIVPQIVLVVRDITRHRDRDAYHATLGRFSEQMAHDIRNPLQAIKGATEFLLEERRRGALDVESAGTFLQLILDQTARLERTVSHFRRLGRVDPVRALVDPGELLGRVAGAQSVALPANITLACAIEPDLPRVELDPDLIAVAVENLIRNAVEAMSGGGAITVAASVDGHARLRLTVRDTGPGMDARRAGRVFDEFYTSKPTGTGLGLPFVRRVAEAHGGDVWLESEEGRGTSVGMRLPITTPAA